MQTHPFFMEQLEPTLPDKTCFACHSDQLAVGRNIALKIDQLLTETYHLHEAQ